MTASELIHHALIANCTIRSEGSKFTFTCPKPSTSCSSCGMWNIPNLTPRCLFWDEDLVPKSLQFEATAILQTTHPELFI